MAGREFVLFAVLGITWGSLWLLTGGGPDPLPLLCAGAIQFGLAALLLGIYGVARRDKTAAGGRFSSGSGVVMGLMLLALPYACTAWASGSVHPYLRAAAPGLPAIVYAAMPLTVMLMLGEDAGRYLPRLLFGLTGVALLVAQGAVLDVARWMPELVLTVGMVAYGFALVYGARRLRGDGERRGTSNLVAWCALQYGSAAVVLALMAAANGDWARLAANISAVEPGRWFGVALAAGISAVTLPIFYRVLEILGPIPAAALQWLITLTGVLETAVLLPVAWTWENWAGLTMSLGALWWVLRKEKTPENMLLRR
jgi:drug/metabolite transporter (DMT)-like permease